MPSTATHTPLPKVPGAEPVPGYRLIEPLGTGGFGEVWKCEAPGGLHKAVKFVHGEEGSLLGNERSGAEQELHALQHVKSIRHPFLLSMDRVEFVGGELVIIMELADQSLHDLLQECRAEGQPGLSRADLLFYLREAAEVLDLMNQDYGLQHLDIKPRNLFLVGGHIKVADFGLVSSLADLNARSAAREQLAAITPLYAAPESFAGKITLFSDQYSLAIVYQEMLTGRLPFAGKNFRQLMLQHTQCEPDLAPLPASDRPVIARALAKEPRERFPCCMDFIRALIGQPAETATGGGKSGSLAEIARVEQGRGPAPRSSGRQPRLRPAGGELDKTRLTGDSPEGAPPEAAWASLDDYHFLDCLGQSPLGEVWKAAAPDGSPRLLKLINTFTRNGLFGEEDPVARLRAIRHPGLVPAMYVPREPNRLAVITDLLPDSLGTRLQESLAARQGGVPRRELLAHLLAAAETLDELQRLYQVQHLGLTPRNLVLADDKALVADFGLVALVWLPAGQSVAQINARYAAPELLNHAGAAGSTPYSRHCDQYSLALIYHELLTGMHLFGNMTPRQLAVARSSGRLGLDLLPGPDRYAVGRALHPDPAKRFDSCTDLVRALLQATPPADRPDSAVDLGETLDQPETEVPPLLSSHVGAGFEMAVAELVAAAAGAAEAREHQQIRYLYVPGEGLVHRCYARLVPGTLRIKLTGFSQDWRARVVEKAEDGFVFHLPLSSSFWSRCFGQPPALTVQVRMLPPRSHQAVMTEVELRIGTTGCDPARGEKLLGQHGPAILASLRGHLNAGGERRTSLRFPFDRPLQVRPVLGGDHLGIALVCQGKDLSLGGMGLYVPCKPPGAHLLIQLPRPGQDRPVGAPAQIVRAESCLDGRYEVGVRFLPRE